MCGRDYSHHHNHHHHHHHSHRNKSRIVVDDDDDEHSATNDELPCKVFVRQHQLSRILLLFGEKRRPHQETHAQDEKQKTKRNTRCSYNDSRGLDKACGRQLQQHQTRKGVLKNLSFRNVYMYVCVCVFLHPVTTRTRLRHLSSCSTA